MFKKSNKKVSNQFKEINKKDLREKVNGGAKRPFSTLNNLLFPSVPAEEWQ